MTHAGIQSDPVQLELQTVPDAELGVKKQLRQTYLTDRYVTDRYRQTPLLLLISMPPITRNTQSAATALPNVVTLTKNG